ncbi:MAG: cytochrome c3 family protein [Nitrospirota bacterium]
MRLKTIYWIILTLLFIVRAAEAESVTIKYPPDMTVMEFDRFNVSMEVPSGSADLIKVKVNDRDAVKIIPDSEYECFSVTLALGVNKIGITASKKGVPVFETVLSAFRRSDLAAAFTKVPAGYTKEHFHMGDTSACTECHILEPKETDRKPVSPTSFIVEAFDKKTVIQATSTCYSCHKKLAASPYVHGPVVVWSCLSCHDDNSDPKYSVKSPDTEICYGCHIEQKTDWQSKKFVHGPVTLGKCKICHSPHGSDYPFNLYKASWDLCVNCHVEKASGRHILGDSFSTEGHPTHNKPDPIRIGKELSCASCHNPHASNFPHLWAFEVQNMFELCKKCHYDK